MIQLTPEAVETDANYTLSVELVNLRAEIELLIFFLKMF